MCAPILSVDPLHAQGAQIIGALEVEAHFGQEFKAHEEEQLVVMAGIVAALLVRYFTLPSLLFLIFLSSATSNCE